MSNSQAEPPRPRDLGEHNHWEVRLRICPETGKPLLSAYMESMGYSTSGRVFEAELPDDVDAEQLGAREALAIISAAERVAIGGSHFGHAPRWQETNIHRISLASALR